MNFGLSFVFYKASPPAKAPTCPPPSFEVAPVLPQVYVQAPQQTPVYAAHPAAQPESVYVQVPQQTPVYAAHPPSQPAPVAIVQQAQVSYVQQPPMQNCAPAPQQTSMGVMAAGMLITGLCVCHLRVFTLKQHNCFCIFNHLIRYGSVRQCLHFHIVRIRFHPAHDGAINDATSAYDAA